MFRTLFTALAAAGAAAVLFANAACAQDAAAHTTRIVPTDSYGATVTMEEGVRVACDEGCGGAGGYGGD